MSEEQNQNIVTSKTMTMVSLMSDFVDNLYAEFSDRNDVDTIVTKIVLSSCAAVVASTAFSVGDGAIADFSRILSGLMERRDQRVGG